jgi:hypothetical protein
LTLAWPPGFGAEDGGKRKTTTAQTPVARTTSPPPIQERVAWFFGLIRKRQSEFMVSSSILASDKEYLDDATDSPVGPANSDARNWPFTCILFQAAQKLA